MFKERPKLNELHLLCGDLSFHIVHIVESWLDEPVLDNELTISSYSLGKHGTDGSSVLTSI